MYYYSKAKIIKIIYCTIFVVESTSDVSSSKSTNPSFNVNDNNAFMTSHGKVKLK